ncbi:hypothetical protein AGMMS49938_04200 [Fibrobacterales bacterium]|nr:hypothetical protein AGMMS49938_04200 [Fibrobacterales bacterium]
MTLFVFATELEQSGVFPNGVPAGYDCVITGVGIIATALTLSKKFSGNKEIDFAIQIGIAGAYSNSNLKIGEVVNVKSDLLLEFKPWEPNEFFASADLPFKNDLQPVKSATVLHCTDTDEIGLQRGTEAQIETMEGAAFFATCREYGVPSVQIRAVSNIAAKYNKDDWCIESALAALSELFKGNL